MGKAGEIGFQELHVVLQQRLRWERSKRRDRRDRWGQTGALTTLVALGCLSSKVELTGWPHWSVTGTLSQLNVWPGLPGRRFQGCDTHIRAQF